MKIWKLTIWHSDCKLGESLHFFKFMARRAERREWVRRQALGVYLVERLRFPKNVGTYGRLDGCTFTTYVDRENLGL